MANQTIQQATAMARTASATLYADFDVALAVSQTEADRTCAFDALSRGLTLIRCDFEARISGIQSPKAAYRAHLAAGLSKTEAALLAARHVPGPETTIARQAIAALLAS